MADTESTVTVRRSEKDEGPKEALLVDDVPSAPSETRDRFREAVPGAARSPWRSPGKKIGMG